MNNISNLIETINKHLNGAASVTEDGQAVLVTKENLLNALRLVKENSKLSMLADITSVDNGEGFELIYHVMQEDASIVRIKVMLPKDNPTIPTITSIWKAADVEEREIYDLMGIVFQGHPNLKRILCTDDFEGHPLRKDFKLNIAERF